MSLDIICDAGYGKTKNQILMRYYPGRVLSSLGIYYFLEQAASLKNPSKK